MRTSTATCAQTLRCRLVDVLHRHSKFCVRPVQACAQVLLTQDNLVSRAQYLNARNTFEELFNYGTVPVVNENDTVATEQVRFGDNDTLSAQACCPSCRGSSDGRQSQRPVGLL